MSKNLNKLDYEILKILQSNARASISEISRKLGLSRATVRQRIRKLHSAGIIKGFTVDLDEALVGQGLKVLVVFKASNIKRLLDELAKTEEVTKIYITSGEKNVFCEAVVPSVKALSNLMDKFLALGFPNEANIVLKTVRSRGGLLKLGFKLRCDYCGKEIADTPYTYTLHNREFNLCCPTCLREFRKSRHLLGESVK